MAGYPAIEPYDSGLLEVGDGNFVYWEVCGNPSGKPALFVHGGPGGGCSEGQRRMFDPARYRVVLFDQRNCGRSLPHAADPDTDLSANTTPHLIADIELLREHLGIDRWLVCGGSWGSTLAFAYAEQHPDRVSEMVHVAVTNTTRAEIDWLYGGLGRFFPQEWDEFRSYVGADTAATGTELAAAYDRLLNGTGTGTGSADDVTAVRVGAARAWSSWEDAVLALDAGRKPGSRFEADPRFELAFARLCAHYFSHLGFLDDGALLRGAPALRDIPGVLIHGQLDLGSPVITAWRMAQAWPNADLRVIPGAGHATGPGLGETVVAALDAFSARG